MKILVAPDSFKGTISAREFCETAVKAINIKYPSAEIIGIPVADGGEGTVDSFVYSVGAELIRKRVTGPYGETVDAYWGKYGDTAIIEMSAASGLPLAGDKKDPLKATTFGTGELIADALDKGADSLIIGLGGSATNDGGIGCLSALGIRFYDESGISVSADCEGCGRVHSIDTSGLDPRLESVDITILCDVNNPLCGENGASYIYAPQKGATAEMLPILDRNLSHFSDTVKTVVGVDAADLPGSGAAGGLGYGLRAFLNCQIKSGAQTVLSMCGFDEKVKSADCVITGEGRFDEQSMMGKVPNVVLKRSEGKPVIVVCGISKLSRQEAVALGFANLLETNSRHLPFEEVRLNAKQMLFDTLSTIELSGY